MRVFIYRHAHAEPGEVDELRKLTSKGRSQIRALAGALSHSVFDEVSEIWHSSLVRAIETAVMFQQLVPVLGNVSLHTVYELDPSSKIDVMARLLGQCEGDVIAVGHNPFLEELVTELCSGEAGLGLISLKKGGMVCLERTVEVSKNTPAGLWTIQWYFLPKL